MVSPHTIDNSLESSSTQVTYDYWQLIRYNYEQIRHAELKASLIISLYSIFLTVAYTFDVLDEENVYSFDFNEPKVYFVILFFLPPIIFTILSFSSCVRCFLPRLNFSVKPSPLFFGDIASNWKNFDSYSKDLINVIDNEPEYKVHLSQMAYVTGSIADKKFRHVSKAIRLLIKSVISFIIFFIVIYI